MRKIRTKFRSGSVEELKERNDRMLKQYVRLINKGKKGKMEIYQELADEFGIEERNSVYAIIKEMTKEPHYEN